LEPPDRDEPAGAGRAKPLPRTILGRYRIEKRLGKGGMGEVLLARDELLDRLVALKQVIPSGEDPSHGRRAMLKEARRASQINDRRIASIYDVLELDGEIVLVMEFVEGVTLRERMTEPLLLEQFWPLALQCVEGVAAAHAHGVIHRDLKPENLMVTPAGEIKFLDFGIAKRSGTSTVFTGTLTDSRALDVAGTPQYMAPEIHLGARADERTDLFSLGVIFYELLTGNRPFEGTTYAIVVDRILNVVPTPVVDLNPPAGDALSRVVDRMLAKDPAERIASAGELRERLEAARSGEVMPMPRGAAAGRRPIATDARTVTVGTPAAASLAGRLRSRAVPILMVGAAAGLGWGWWKVAAAPALPRDRNVAVVAPRTIDPSDDFASFTLGAIELLSARLQKHGDQPGFQMAVFQDGWDEKVHSAEEARRVEGANLALVPTLEQRPDVFRARLDLFDTAHERVIASRTFEVPASEPFALLDRLYRGSASMLALKPRDGDARAEYGIQGAGTLRFHLQGLGRMRAAEDESAARRAVEDFELACKTEPEAAVAHAGRAAAELRRHVLTKDTEWLSRSEASAREAIALDSTRADGHRILGLALARKKDAEGSLAALRRAAELLPTDDETCSRLGRAYGKLGRDEDEKEVYLAAIHRRPHSWQPYWWLATWGFRQGRIDEAITAYEDMVRRAPDLHKGHSGLGGLLVLKGEYKRAIESLKRSIELRPTKIAFDNLGTAYFNSGRLRDAIACYNQSFQFGFADYQSWLNLGDAYFWLRERKDLASQAYLQSIRLGREEIQSRAAQGRSTDVMIAANLSTVFPKVGQPDSARAYIAAAVAADSTNPMVEYCAALTHWQLNDKSGAFAWLDKSVRDGYPQVWIRDSPIFREWRKTGEFRAIVDVAAPGPRSSEPGKPGG
jgi:eukaryotic-like serine/threonine-protein kinase